MGIVGVIKATNATVTFGGKFYRSLLAWPEGYQVFLEGQTIDPKGNPKAPAQPTNAAGESPKETA